MQFRTERPIEKRCICIYIFIIDHFYNLIYTLVHLARITCDNMLVGQPEGNKITRLTELEIVCIVTPTPIQSFN